MMLEIDCFSFRYVAKSKMECDDEFHSDCYRLSVHVGGDFPLVVTNWWLVKARQSIRGYWE